MQPRDHALFKRFPLSGKAKLSIGEVPTPYHIYDGYGLFIGGTADLEPVKRLIANEQVIPMQTEDGRALMGLWICDFTDASLEPHHELQFSIFISRGPVRSVPAQPLALLAAMLTRRDMQMMCHGLWNNTSKVVAYNRELLSLDARLTASTIQREASSIRFAFTDAPTGAALLTGSCALPARTPQALNSALMGQMGFFKAIRSLMAPSIHMEVVNPLGVVLPRNATADAYTKTASTTLHTFDTQTDRLDIEAPRYRDLNFTPQLVQFMDGFKFVYLTPR
ncbi:MAG: hypothetical protein U0670_21715 [Anaerolineae bacterium]